MRGYRAQESLLCSKTWGNTQNPETVDLALHRTLLLGGLPTSHSGEALLHPFGMSAVQGTLGDRSSELPQSRI